MGGGRQGLIVPSYYSPPSQLLPSPTPTSDTATTPGRRRSTKDQAADQNPPLPLLSLPPEEGEVQKLRYKNLQVLRVEAVDLRQAGRLQAGAGVKEFTEMGDLSAYLGECGVLEWWRRNMGYVHTSADIRGG